MPNSDRIEIELIRDGDLGGPPERMKQVMMGQIQGADMAEGPLAQVFKPVQFFFDPLFILGNPIDK